MSIHPRDISENNHLSNRTLYFVAISKTKMYQLPEKQLAAGVTSGKFLVP
jgi:hypothetical protein